MNRDRRHLRPDVARQVRRRQRRQHRRRGGGAGQHRAPLEVARLRTGDRRALGVGVRRRPLAPRLVRRPGVARAREDLDLRCRPARWRARPSRPTSIRAARPSRPTRTCRAWRASSRSTSAGRDSRSRRRCDRPPRAIMRGLLRRHAGHQHRAHRIAAQPKQLALRAGGHQQRAVRLRSPCRTAHLLLAPTARPTVRRAARGRPRRSWLRRSAEEPRHRTATPSRQVRPPKSR